MLIEQLIDLEKVSTENLKIRTDLQDRVMDGLINNTVDDYTGIFLKNILFNSKIKKSKLKHNKFFDRKLWFRLSKSSKIFFPFNKAC